MSEKLENKIREIELKIERQEAVNEIRNLMGRYEAMRFTTKEIVHTPELLATWRPDVSVEEAAHGVVMGTENAIARWEKVKTGNLNAACKMHLASTAVIEVAGNGQTAKGTFISFCFETGIKSLEDKDFIER